MVFVGATIPKPPIVKRLLVLLLILIVVAGMLALTYTKIALSVLLGGLVCLMPSISFSWYVFHADAGAGFAKRVPKRFYRAEVIKSVLAVMLFILVFSHSHLINIAWFFVAYIVCQLLVWLIGYKTMM